MPLDKPGCFPDRALPGKLRAQRGIHAYIFPLRFMDFPVYG
jgi:hypothetical protein